MLIDKFIKDLGGNPNSEAQLQLLKLALSIKQNHNNLNEARETARRNIDITADDLVEMVALADKAREESYEDNYCLMQVLDAAAVHHCSITDRMDFSIRLAVACKDTKRYDEAKNAYAATLESSHILM